MRNLSSLMSAALLCAAFALAPAHAAERQGAKAQGAETPTSQTKVVTGSGLICDTKEQAARFVSLMDDNVERTLLAVNREAGVAHACVVATVGFIPGSKVADVDKDGAVIYVIEVKVVAVATVLGLQPVEPKTYYSVIASKERNV